MCKDSAIDQPEFWNGFEHYMLIERVIEHGDVLEKKVIISNDVTSTESLALSSLLFLRERSGGGGAKLRV